MRESAQPQVELRAIHFQHWEAWGGEIITLFYRIDDRYLIRFPGRADFTIDFSGNVVSCRPCPEVSESIVTALYSNQVVPLLASSAGDLVLHASAAVGGFGAFAFLGASGRGKSTIAANFARAGCPFLTDDGLWLEKAGTGYLAKPNRPDMRLWHDSMAAVVNENVEISDSCEKLQIVSDQTLPFHDRPVPLRVIYVLGEGLVERVSIDRLKPAFTISELLRHAFILDVDDRQRHGDHFERIAQLAGAVKCYALDYPRRYSVLPDVTAMVLEHAQSIQDE